MPVARRFKLLGCIALAVSASALTPTVAQAISFGPVGGTAEITTSRVFVSTPLASGVCVISAPGNPLLPIGSGAPFALYFGPISSMCVAAPGSPPFTLTGADWNFFATSATAVDLRLHRGQMTFSVPSLNCTMLNDVVTNPGGRWTNGAGTVQSSMNYAGSVGGTWADDGGSCARRGVASAITFSSGTTFRVQTTGNPAVLVTLNP